MGQIKFMVGLVLASLFAIGIISFAVMFGIDNGTRINIINDSDFSGIRDNLIGNVTIFYSDINTSSDAMYKSTVSTQTEATEGGTSFKVGPTTALSMARQVINSSFRKIFGSDNAFSVFVTALVAILGFISIMYLYKAWAGRNPD